MEDKRTIKDDACWTCSFWNVNAITQHTGMSRCIKKKKFSSYFDVCLAYQKDKVGCNGGKRKS